MEINYYLGLDNEAKEFAKILGYNYNSSEWYQKSYKILNKDYKIKNITSNNEKNKEIEKNFLEKIINIIK